MTDPASLPYRACAGVMLINGDGKVFVGQRIDSTLDAWQMPQGGIDDGEDAQAAALRELQEEAGVDPAKVTVLAEIAAELTYDLPPELVGKVWKGRYRGQRQRWFLCRLDADDSVIDIATDHPEFSRWQWVDPEQLPDLIVPFKRDLYRRVLKEFRPHLGR